MILTSTSDLIRGQSDQNADFEINVRYFDNNAGAITPARPANQSITNTTQTTLVGSPGSGVQRIVDYISIKNNHASQAANFTIDHFDGSVASEGPTFNLLAGEFAIYNGFGWQKFDAGGNPYTAVGPVATQAEMEAGSSLLTFVTPGRAQFHPSSIKAWGKANGAGTSLQVNYNVSGISDTGTGRLGVTIGTDFSSANWAAVADIERSATGLGEGTVEMHALRNASIAAGAFEIESIDHTATTMVAQDPGSYTWVCAGDQ